MLLVPSCKHGGAQASSDGAIPRSPHPPIPAIAVAGGAVHTCILHSNQTVSCVGANYGGQFGSGQYSPDLTFNPVFIPGVSGAVQLVAGVNHVCARLAAGTVSCWGANDFGQMGLGDGASPDVPGKAGDLVLGLAGATQIAAGYEHNCAVTSDGKAWCWGGNRAGRLGDGTADQRNAPTAVKIGSPVTAIAAGNFHTCALLADATVQCWGSNDEGEIGDGTNTPSRLPVPVAGLHDVVEIAAGGLHSCARLRDGTVSCWGDATGGALGGGDTAVHLGTVAVAGVRNAVAIAAGYRHSCALIADGTAQCWGTNDHGQIGTSGPAVVPSPVVVAGLADATAIGLGYQHSCAV